MLTQTHKWIYVFDSAFMCLDNNRIWGDILMSLRQGSDKLPFIKMIICFYHFFLLNSTYIWADEQSSVYICVNFFDANFLQNLK